MKACGTCGLYVVEGRAKYCSVACKEAAVKKSAAKSRLTTKAREEIMRSMGLTKVRGERSGKIYWE